MNHSNLAKILGTANLIDPRVEVSEASVLTWHTLIGDLTAKDVAEAVEHHYATSSARIMPADVRAAVKTIRGARLDGVDVDVPDVDPDDTAAWLAALRTNRAARADGALPPPAPQPEELDPRVRAALPAVFRRPARPLAVAAEGGEKPRAVAPPAREVPRAEADVLERERARQLARLSGMLPQGAAAAS